MTRPAKRKRSQSEGRVFRAAMRFYRRWGAWYLDTVSNKFLDKDNPGLQLSKACRAHRATHAARRAGGGKG